MKIKCNSWTSAPWRVEELENKLMESREWWHLKRLTGFSRIISDSTVTAYWCKTYVRQNSEIWRKKESGVGEKGDVIVILNVIDLAESACHQIIFIHYRIHLKDSANCHLLPQHFHKWRASKFSMKENVLRGAYCTWAVCH